MHKTSTQALRCVADGANGAEREDPHLGPDQLQASVEFFQQVLSLHKLPGYARPVKFRLQ